MTPDYLTLDQSIYFESVVSHLKDKQKTTLIADNRPSNVLLFTPKLYPMVIQFKQKHKREYFQSIKKMRKSRYL